VRQSRRRPRFTDRLSRAKNPTSAGSPRFPNGEYPSVAEADRSGHQARSAFDEHLGKLGAHRIERAHDPLLGGDDLIAQGRRLERGALPEGAGADQFAVTLGLSLANQ
jgi:hypothetical protein